METVKVYINSNNTATFSCKQCHLIRTVDVSNYVDKKKSIKVKVTCKCGNVYSVFLERRKNYRKGTNIPGIYVKETNIDGEFTVIEGGEKGRIVILDISSTGIRFKLHLEKKLNIEDIINVEFRLDDKERTFIKKNVRIKRINGMEIGAEYCDKNPSDPMDKAINWYLFK